MRQVLAIAVILMGAASIPAGAFETVPTPSRDTGARRDAEPAPADPSLALERQQGGKAAVAPKARGWFARRLDFGLELMYGDEHTETQAIEPAPNDVSVLGTVKRRF